MRFKGLSAFTVTIGIMLFTSFGFSARADSEPSAFFPQTLYEFSAVLDGAEVVHEFVIQNKGAAPLKIEKVSTG